MQIKQHTELNIVQVNMRGTTDETKRNKVYMWGTRYEVGIMMSSETKIHTHCAENYVWLFSRDVNNEKRDAANKNESTT